MQLDELMLQSQRKVFKSVWINVRKCLCKNRTFANLNWHEIHKRISAFQWIPLLSHHLKVIECYKGLNFSLNKWSIGVGIQCMHLLSGVLAASRVGGRPLHSQCLFDSFNLCCAAQVCRTLSHQITFQVRFQAEEIYISFIWVYGCLSLVLNVGTLFCYCEVLLLYW